MFSVVHVATALAGCVMTLMFKATAAAAVATSPVYDAHSDPQGSTDDRKRKSRDKSSTTVT